MALSDDFNRLIRQLEQAGVPTKRFREEMERAQRAGEGTT